jgi:hypothetical protein
MSGASLVLLAARAILASAPNVPAAAPPPPAPIVAPPPAPAPVTIVTPPPPRPAPPALAQSERARYRIAFGGLEVGQLSVSFGGAAPGATIVHVAGQGAGAVFGLGRYENQIDSDFDLARLDSTRWVNERTWANRSTRDRGEQPVQGEVRAFREPIAKVGAPAASGVAVPMQAKLAGPLLDPLGIILRLRAAPPSPGAPAQTLYVLDGQALWRVTIANQGRAPLPDGHVQVATIKLSVEAEPIRYDGSSDVGGDRHHRSISVWMSDDANRVPIRLSVSVGLGDVVASLTEIERRPL